MDWGNKSFDQILAEAKLQGEKEKIIKGPYCDHGVKFDPEEAKGLDAYEVRKKFPRMWGPCPKGCGFNGIAYASPEHYIAGDW